MTFGKPLIYKCPSCKKKMWMPTYNSYSVHKLTVYSDCYTKGRPHFTPDLSKCPHCKNLFFRHNIKNPKRIDRKAANDFERIVTPESEDLINALSQKTAKDWKEDKQLRQDLWRSINNITRYGSTTLNSELLETWKTNCAALIPLAEKALTEMQLPKNSKKYDDEDKANTLIMIAELNRNIGSFDKCIEQISQLSPEYDWLKNQFTDECNAKNPFTFELTPKDEYDTEGDTDGKHEAWV